MAHFAIRGLMHEAALKADEDPDRLSFIHSVHVVQRRMARYGAIPPSAEKSSPRSDSRRNSRGARRFESYPDQPARREAQDEQLQSSASQAPAHPASRRRQAGQDY